MGHVHYTINSNTHVYTSRVTGEDIRGEELDPYNTEPSCQELAKDRQERLPLSIQT